MGLPTLTLCGTVERNAFSQAFLGFAESTLNLQATYRNSFFRFGFKLSSVLLVRMCALEVRYIG